VPLPSGPTAYTELSLGAAEPGPGDLTGSSEALVFYVIAALIVGATLVWLGRRGQRRRRAKVRVAALVFALLAAVGAVITALELRWYVAVPLAALAAWLWARLFVLPPADKTRQPPSMAMTDQRARALLGVGASASASEIQAAYLRLIRMAHPDRGGTSGLAAELNAARDRLLGRS
jgi:lysylphosphatidylglycerol synthetase-like protein (DUF2156 family)